MKQQRGQWCWRGGGVGVSRARGNGPQKFSYTGRVLVVMARFYAGPEKAQISFCLVLFILI